jgi:uncharacterized protein DUF4255
MGDTLVYLLRAGVPPLVNPNDITLSTPDDFESAPNQPAITVFLYRVAINPEMRNGPKRVLPDGQVTRPLLPLDLRYLITAWARDTRGELQIVGRILQVLYDHAELGPADLQGASWEVDDSVQLVWETLPIEDHYRVWDTTDIPYRLSLTYVARVIGLAPTEAHQFPPVLGATFQ